MIIAFAGRKQSGKTSGCEFTANVFARTLQKNASIYNFADPLKKMCIEIFGLTHDQCYGTDEQKNEYVDANGQIAEKQCLLEKLCSMSVLTYLEKCNIMSGRQLPLEKYRMRICL